MVNLPARQVFDGLMNVRELITFYLFIYEESIQSLGMACYILQKEGKYDEMRLLAMKCVNEYIDPVLFWAQTVGTLAFPMNDCFIAFYEASKESMNVYINYTG